MPEGTDFLYPFIEGDERDAGPLLLDLARSAAGKHELSLALRTAVMASAGETLAAAADAMAMAFAAGGRLFSFGNGGARPTPRPWPLCSLARRPAGRSRRVAWPTTRPC